MRYTTEMKKMQTIYRLYIACPFLQMLHVDVKKQILPNSSVSCYVIRHVSYDGRKYKKKL